jgi:hypothetical protein
MYQFVDPAEIWDPFGDNKINWHDTLYENRSFRSMIFNYTRFALFILCFFLLLGRKAKTLCKTQGVCSKDSKVR